MYISYGLAIGLFTLFWLLSTLGVDRAARRGDTTGVYKCFLAASGSAAVVAAAVVELVMSR